MRNGSPVKINLPVKRKNRFKIASPQKLFPKEIEQTDSSNFCGDFLWDSSVSDF